MVSFSPDDSPVTPEELHSQVMEQRKKDIKDMFLPKIQKLLQFHHEQCSLLSPVKDKPQYSHYHRQIKRKGGHAPLDFIAAEVAVDLRLAATRGDWPEAIKCYYQLRYMLQF